jgi:hypothetical protein
MTSHPRKKISEPEFPSRLSQDGLHKFLAINFHAELLQTLLFLITVRCGKGEKILFYMQTDILMSLFQSPLKINTFHSFPLSRLLTLQWNPFLP